MGLHFLHHITDYAVSADSDRCWHHLMQTDLQLQGDNISSDGVIYKHSSLQKKIVLINKRYRIAYHKLMRGDLRGCQYKRSGQREGPPREVYT